MRRQIVFILMVLSYIFALSVHGQIVARGKGEDPHFPDQEPAQPYNWKEQALKTLPPVLGAAGIASGAYFFSQEGEYDCKTPILCCVPWNPNNCGSPVVYAHQCEEQLRSAPYCTDPVTQEATVEIHPVSKSKSILPGALLYTAGVASFAALVPVAIYRLKNQDQRGSALVWAGIVTGIASVIGNGIWMGLDQRFGCNGSETTAKCCINGTMPCNAVVNIKNQNYCPGKAVCVIGKDEIDHTTDAASHVPTDIAAGVGGTFLGVGAIAAVVEIIVGGHMLCGFAVF